MAQLLSGLGGPPMYKTESASLDLQASSTASAILPVSGGTACTVVRGTRPLRMSEAKSFMAEADAALYV